MLTYGDERTSNHLDLCEARQQHLTQNHLSPVTIENDWTLPSRSQ
ncbi:hypothetical protein C7405_11092 [Paraburkholderia caballeronis]|nr:hypothetical protein C7405_11092 [Paraburkholderia caballeronis]